jgi:hypothetical protein
MKKKAKVAGIGAALIAILSVITFGLIKRKKQQDEEE